MDHAATVCRLYRTPDALLLQLALTSAEAYLPLPSCSGTGLPYFSTLRCACFTLPLPYHSGVLTLNAVTAPKSDETRAENAGLQDCPDRPDVERYRRRRYRSSHAQGVDPGEPNSNARDQYPDPSWQLRVLDIRGKPFVLHLTSVCVGAILVFDISAALMSCL